MAAKNRRRVPAGRATAVIDRAVGENIIIVPGHPENSAQPVVDAHPEAVESEEVESEDVRPEEVRPETVVPVTVATTVPTRAGGLAELDAIDQIARAEAIATIAHRDQVDTIGEPYIDHPARVAEAFDDVIPHCAAWLHDVLEETELTADDLLDAGVLPDIVEIVEVLTRDEEATSSKYFERIRQNPIALAIKSADIDDNLAPWRTRLLPPDARVRLASKYRQARLALGIETLP